MTGAGAGEPGGRKTTEGQLRRAQYDHRVRVTGTKLNYNDS